MIETVDLKQIVVIHTDEDDPEFGRDIATATGLPVIVIGLDDSLESLDVDAMRELGWQPITESVTA